MLSNKSHRTEKKKCSEETPRAKCAKASSAKRLRWLGEGGGLGGGHIFNVKDKLRLYDGSSQTIKLSKDYVLVHHQRFLSSVAGKVKR